MQTEEAASYDPFSLAELKSMGATAGPCLTLMMPYQAVAEQRGQMATRLKNLLKGAEQACQTQSVPEAEARQLLEPVRALGDLQDVPGTGKSLVIFRSKEVFRVFRVPQEIEDIGLVGSAFYIRPLLTHLTEERDFYLLALSSKHLRLLHCTEHSSEEVPLPAQVPKSLGDDEQSDAPDHRADNMGVAGPSSGSMKGVMSGTGNDKENHPDHLLHFYQHIDKGLRDLFKNEKRPLVIAGVEKELALYHKANTYPHLVDGGVHGAPDGLKGGEMHRRALEIVKPKFDEALDKALHTYERLGVERISSHVQDIVKAAWDGRVSHLFIQEHAEYKGTFHEATQRIGKEGEEDLLNASAWQTLLHGGQVFVVPGNKVPQGARAAAIFRY